MSVFLLIFVLTFLLVWFSLRCDGWSTGWRRRTRWMLEEGNRCRAAPTHRVRDQPLESLEVVRKNHSMLIFEIG